MLWLKHTKYTSEYYAIRLAEIIGDARCSTRCMVYVASCAVSVLAVVEMSCIYGL